jgi:hypothetical protein
MRHHGIGIAIALDDIDGTFIAAGRVLVLQRTRLLLGVFAGAEADIVPEIVEALLKSRVVAR